MKSYNRISALLIGASTLAMCSTAMAQTAGDEVIATGIRQSLESALIEKREANSLIEVILAEDIGKLPDQNLAEVLENITGVQITRTSGVGTNVQIRGTDDNRTEINGVSTLGSGSGRGGIDFEDVNSSIIAGVEVIKVPEAKTIEGSVGGTINLRTIRPLDLDEPLIAARVQGEINNLSEEGIQPRLSGSLGNKWETGAGEVGIVVSGSFSQQDAVSFRPRVDRDVLANVDIDGDGDDEQFLGIQFLVQEQENNEFENINIAGTGEWAPNDELRFYVDGFYNNQENRQDSFRLQASGISTFVDDVVPTSFEQVDFGTGVDFGNGPGVIDAALTGVIARNGINDDNGNLRFSSDTGARTTDSSVLSFGGEWERDNYTVSAEYARSRSSTVNPNLSTTLNFINPNTNLVGDIVFIETDDDGNFLFEDFDGEETTNSTGIDGDGNVVEFDPITDDINVGFGINPTFGGANITSVQDAVDAVPNAFLTDLDLDTLLGRNTPGQVATVNLSQIFNDNSTPFEFDLNNETLAFGIATGDPEAPTSAQLLNPANVILDDLDNGANETDNTEDALRFDVSFDTSDSRFGDVLTSFDAGYRYNNSSSRFADIEDDLGFGVLEDSPNGLLFEELLVPGPTNFDAGDGRELFIQDFLLIDPDAAFSDPAGTLATLEAAIAQQRVLNPLANGELTSEPVSDQNAFFDVTENTHAVYGQLNFESGIFRGNLGARYVNTNVNSVAFGPEDDDGVRNLVPTEGSYDFILPRFNLIANATDNIVVRLGYSSDILRPNFTDLNTAFTFDTSENAAVAFGNPGLEPETVDSFDVSAEWYFAPASVISVGFFEKNRTNLLSSSFEDAVLLDSDDTPGGLARETDPTCPGGGTFNPDVVPNVLGDPATTGLCVPFTIPSNDPAVTTQRGIELAFQGDLSSFEDRLGFASGFGIQANYTYQEFSGGSVIDEATNRGLEVLGETFIPEGLLDFSQNAYNITGFYEKYGLSARLRWTWRDEFRTNDFGGGANTSGSSTFGFPVFTEARGQLNGSISYDVTDQFTIGVEGVNLTTSNIVQRAVSPEGPIAFVGIPDRRIIFGGSYTF